MSGLDVGVGGRAGARPWKDEQLQTLLWSVAIIMEQRHGPKHKWVPVDRQFRVWKLDVPWRDAKDLKNKHNTWRAANKDLPRPSLDNESLKVLVELFHGVCEGLGHTDTYTHIHTQTHTYTHIHTQTHTYTHIHTHTYTHMYTHTNIHIYVLLII
jgi:hypothetical protein